MFKKVCFLVNYNQYETKRYFTEKFIEALRRGGVEAVSFDVNEQRVDGKLVDDIAATGADFTASFNSFIPFPDNTYLWDIIGKPHLSILLDPSLYSVGLVDSPLSIISCVDNFDCYGLQTQSFDRVFFMPHAVERELCDLPDEEKEYDIVFFGSCYDYPTMRKTWEREFPEFAASAIADAVEIVLSDDETPLQEALVQAWKKTGRPPEGIDFLKMFAFVDKYSRGLDRVELIRSINSGKVHVFGELFEDDPTATKGWRDLLSDRGNVIFHKPVPYSEALKVLRKSKVCLNSSPFFKCGSHERIFAGLACGAAVVTSSNIFIREEFQDGEDIVLYHSKKWGEIDERVEELLKDEDKRRALVAKGRGKVKERHTWDQRVELLKNAIPYMMERMEKSGQKSG